VFLGFTVRGTHCDSARPRDGLVTRIERNVDPLVESFSPIARSAILPLAILWL